MLACSPELETLALIISRMTKRIHLRGQSLKCMRLWTGVVEGLAVVDAPHLERLILWKSVGDYHHMVLKIGNTIINVLVVPFISLCKKFDLHVSVIHKHSILHCRLRQRQAQVASSQVSRSWL